MHNKKKLKAGIQQNSVSKDNYGIKKLNHKEVFLLKYTNQYW